MKTLKILVSLWLSYVHMKSYPTVLTGDQFAKQIKGDGNGQLSFILNCHPTTIKDAYCKKFLEEFPENNSVKLYSVDCAVTQTDSDICDKYFNTTMKAVIVKGPKEWYAFTSPPEE